MELLASFARSFKKSCLVTANLTWAMLQGERVSSPVYLDLILSQTETKGRACLTDFLFYRIYGEDPVWWFFFFSLFRIQLRCEVNNNYWTVRYAGDMELFEGISCKQSGRSW